MFPNLNLVVVESDSRTAVAAPKVDKKASKAFEAAVMNRLKEFGVESTDSSRCRAWNSMGE
jgi:hypothetical protein